MKKIIKKIYYTNGELNVLLIMVSLFAGIILSVLGFIFLVNIIFKDQIYESDRFEEQLSKNQYLKDNIKDYFYFDYYGIDRIDNETQTYKVIQVALGGGKHAIIDIWYKTEEYNWAFDSVKIIKISDKYIRNSNDYKIDRR